METLCCGHCQQDKPDADFHSAKLNVGRRGRTSWCKLCTNEQNRDRKRKQREAGTLPGLQGAAYHRDYSLRKKYGLDSASVNAMLTEQGGCDICRTDDPGGRGWCVDHDHSTGSVRSILCNSCNTGIGMLKDDPAILRTAADYLDRWSASC